MRVRVGDTRLFVDVHGPKLVPVGPWMRERPTLLLVHPGPGFDHAVYKEHAGPSLAADAQVVYFDQRGHGRSDRAPAEQLRLDVWADDVRTLCETLRIERPVVLGSGFGAMVALRYAAAYPDHAARLVLINPAARVVVSRMVAAYDRLGGAEAGEAALRFYDHPDQHTFADFLRLCLPHFRRRGLPPQLTTRANWNPDVAIRWIGGERLHVDLRPELGNVVAPTLVLAGEDDPQHTPAAAEEVVAGLRNVVSYRVFPEAAHAVFADAPESIEVVRSFVLGNTEAA